MPKGDVDEERLCLEFAVTASRWVTDVADAHCSPESQKGLEMEHFPHETIPFLEMKLLVVRHDSGGILPAVLEEEETVVEVLDDVVRAGNGNHPAHGE